MDSDEHEPDPTPDVTYADNEFDRITRLAKRHLGITAAVFAMLDDDGVRLPGSLGMPEQEQLTRRAGKPTIITRLAIEEGTPIILEDTTEHPEVAEVLSLYGLGHGAAAILPVYDDQGHPLGMLAIGNDRPRSWSAADLEMIADLAAACADVLKTRAEREAAREAEADARKEERRWQFLLGLSEAFADATSTVEIERIMQDMAAQGLGAASSFLALVDSDRRGLTFVSGGPDILLRSDEPDHGEPKTALRTPRRRMSDDLPITEVMRTEGPVYYSSGAEIEQRFPILAGRLDLDGACSLFPVFSNNQIRGVITVRWDGPRDHDPESVSVETTLASYVGHALERVALLEERRLVSTTLQEALLADLPDVPGLDIASTYKPAVRTDQVGGDWYDIVTVNPDTTMAVIGDVTGHDMRAAAQMGQLRSMLRALAWSHDRTPATLLTLLDRANADLGPQAGATAVVVRLDRMLGPSGKPDGYLLTWSNAGHPPPMLLRADGTVDVLEARPDLLLGIHPQFGRTDHATTLAPGETLLLYTDGLVERRGSLPSEGVVELADTLARCASHGTAALPAAFVRSLVGPAQRDDVAVLAVRARESFGSGACRVIASASEVAPARRWVDDILEGCVVDGKTRRMAVLLTSELLTNALIHGGGSAELSVSVLDGGTTRIEVSDSSPVLPVLKNPKPSDGSGRGVQFLDQLASHWGVEIAEAPKPGKTIWFELS